MKTPRLMQVGMSRIATLFLLRTIFGGYRRRRSTAVGGVQSVEKAVNGEHPTGFW